MLNAKSILSASLLPGGLISLSDVYAYHAKRLIAVADHFAACHLRILEEGKEESDRIEIKQRLQAVAKEADFLSLPLTAMLARRIASQPGEITSNNVDDLITSIEERLADEMGNLKLFLVNPNRLKFYENTESAGTEFKDKFPKANGELIEAGNCLATSRHTACVFHLMRALDIALSCFEKQLGIVAPGKGAERTWGKTLGRISDKIENNDKTPPPNWQQEAGFHKQVFALISAVKSPYRDSTMHVESTYDETSATSVFNVTVEALRHIATKLAE